MGAFIDFEVWKRSSKRVIRGFSLVSMIGVDSSLGRRFCFLLIC